MAILLDTNALLWHVASHPRLSATAKQWIDDPAQDVFVSVASLWEITIKTSLGKLQLHPPLPVLLQQHLLRSDVQLLPIEPVHLVRLSTLPHHHRDPFDRLIVAQALDQSLPLVSSDNALDAWHPAHLVIQTASVASLLCCGAWLGNARPTNPCQNRR
jgi:PIN domain nuclease of toxin-antitoxin system